MVHVVCVQEDGSSVLGVELEEVDSAYAYHQCGRRELQVFQSDTYAGIYNQRHPHNIEAR